MVLATLCCKCCRAIGVSNTVFEQVVNQMVLATCSKVETTKKSMEVNVAETIGFTTCSKITFPNAGFYNCVKQWMLKKLVVGISPK